MRRLGLACLALAALAGCSSGSPDGPTAEAEAPIVYGTPDTIHTAVVALLAPFAGSYSACSGTVVQVSGGLGDVLTAAHCCDQSAPTIVESDA